MSFPSGRLLRQCVILTGLGAASALAAPVAEARPGTVYWTTYLRAGPGAGYAVLDEVEPRTQVDVQACQGSWCRVASGRAEGYVEATMLSEPDIHAGPPGEAQLTTCFAARLNGTRSGEDVRFCGK